MLTIRLRIALSITIVFSLVALQIRNSRADETENGFHAAIGLVTGKFSGPGLNANGGFNVPSSIDLEYEFIRQRHFSYFIRTTFSYQLKDGVLPYVYTGGGARYYLWSNSRGYDESEGGFKISKKPNIKIYLGPEVGLSQNIIKQYTQVVQTGTTLIEIGGNAGIVYQLNSNIGLEAKVGYSIGFGISTTIVGANIFRGLIGIDTYF